MTKLEDIESAVAKLAPGELDRFRAWFEDFEADRFDTKIERHVREGKLDALADHALSELRKGNVRDL